MINFFQYRVDKKYLKYLLVLGWISIWASLSFNPNKVNFLFEKTNLEFFANLSLFELVDISRGLFQIFYFTLLVFVSFFLLRTKKIFLKSNLIFFLFLIILLIETFSLLKSNNPNINIFFIICSFNTLLTVFLLKNFFSRTDIILIFRLSIIILIMVIFFFGAQYFINAFKNGVNIYSAWGLVQSNISLDTPKPTGLSRSALIIIIFLSNISFFKKPFNKLNYLIMTSSIILLILLSSRTTIFLYISYVLFCIFYFKIFKPKNLLISLGKFLFIPLVFVFIIGIIQNINIYKNNIDPSLTKDKVFTFNPNKTLRTYPTKIDTIDRGFFAHDHDPGFSSGRILDWKNILRSNKNKFYGNGVLGDRYLINQSASSLIFYTYSSSGAIGLLIIICISLIIFFSILKEIFIKKLNFDSYKFTSSIILVALMMRSILETSYAVFGIDFILFCICFCLIIQNNNSYESN